MPATVTLSTATLAGGLGAGDGEIQLSSVAGIDHDYRLWVDRELMAVYIVNPSNNRITVKRGVDGTIATKHVAGATVTIGTASQFFSSDPTGAPDAVIPVSPYINVVQGRTWLAVGNGTDTDPRWWQQVTTTYLPGAFGNLTVTLDPSAST